MPKGMLGELTLSEFRGPRDALEEALAGDNGREWLNQLKKFNRKEPCWINPETAKVVEPEIVSPIFNYIPTVEIPATTTKFVAKEKFVHNLSKRFGCVQISSFDERFQEWFLSDTGKIEDPTAEQTLGYLNLRRRTDSSLIIKELGGEAKVETSLCAMFSLMERQSKGEFGVLLNDCQFNIFPIRDVSDVLRLVSTCWHNHGWLVSANSINSMTWSKNNRVFFCSKAA